MTSVEEAKAGRCRRMSRSGVTMAEAYGQKDPGAEQGQVEAMPIDHASASSPKTAIPVTSAAKLNVNRRLYAQ